MVLSKDTNIYYKNIDIYNTFYQFDMHIELLILTYQRAVPKPRDYKQMTDKHKELRMIR